MPNEPVYVRSIAFPTQLYAQVKQRAEEQQRSFHWIVVHELEKIFLPQEQSQQKEKGKTQG